MNIPFLFKKRNRSKYCKLSVIKLPNGVDQLIDDRGREVFGVRAITINHGMDIATNATVNLFVTGNDGKHMINREYRNDPSEISEVIRKQGDQTVSEHITSNNPGATLTTKGLGNKYIVDGNIILKALNDAKTTT